MTRPMALPLPKLGDDPLELYRMCSVIYATEARLRVRLQDHIDRSLGLTVRAGEE